MRLSEIGEIAGVVLLLGSALVFAQADGVARAVAVTIGLLSVTLCLRSSGLRGWIGPSYRELAEEVADLDDIIRVRRKPDGSVIPGDEYLKLMDRRAALWAKMAQHPDRPRR